MIKKHTLTLIEHEYTDPAILQWFADCKENLRQVGAMVTLETKVGPFDLLSKEQFEEDLKNHNQALLRYHVDYFEGSIDKEELDAASERLTRALSRLYFLVKND